MKYKVKRAFKNGWIVQDDRGRSIGGIYSSRKQAMRAAKEQREYAKRMAKAYSNPATKRNAGPLSRRKAKKFAKKALKRLGYVAPKKRNAGLLTGLRRTHGSQSWRKKKKRLRKAGFGGIEVGSRRKGRRYVEPNPVPKLKRLTKSTGWMNADAVKIIRNRGKVQVLVRRKPKSRRR